MNRSSSQTAWSSLYQEAVNTYHDIQYPLITTGTAQNFYVVYGSATNFTIGTIALTNPLPIASGGTATGATLNNGRIMTSNGSQIVENPETLAVNRVVCVRAADNFLTTSPGTSVSLNSNLAFNPTTSGIVGTNTNDSASAGNVGQVISAQVTTFANTGATGTTSDITSISVPAGDWLIDALGVIKNNAATVTSWIIGVGTVVGDDLTNVTDGTTRADGINPNAIETQITLAIPGYHVQFSATTTLYLKIHPNFSAGQPQGAGRITAARIR